MWLSCDGWWVMRREMWEIISLFSRMLSNVTSTSFFVPPYGSRKSLEKPFFSQAERRFSTALKVSYYMEQEQRLFYSVVHLFIVTFLCSIPSCKFTEHWGFTNIDSFDEIHFPSLECFTFWCSHDKLKISLQEVRKSLFLSDVELEQFMHKFVPLEIVHSIMCKTSFLGISSFKEHSTA